MLRELPGLPCKALDKEAFTVYLGGPATAPKLWEFTSFSPESLKGKIDHGIMSYQRVRQVESVVKFA